MALNYSKKTLHNFRYPKNIGRLTRPDGYAQIGNPICGDQLDFFLKVEKRRIKDVKFLSFGCASNIATASVLTEKIKGLSLAAAKKYPWQKIVAELGGLPQQKIHCSIMAIQGLRRAIADYEAREGEKKVAGRGKKKKAMAKRKAKLKTGRKK